MSNASTLLESIPYSGFKGITLGNGDVISISSIGRDAIKISDDFFSYFIECFTYF